MQRADLDGASGASLVHASVAARWGCGRAASHASRPSWQEMEEAVTVVHYWLEGTTAVVQMDDGKANALSDAMIDEVGQALARAEKEASALVLAGRPDRFCAGFDLRVMMSSPEAAKALVGRGADVLMRIYG